VSAGSHGFQNRRNGFSLGTPHIHFFGSTGATQRSIAWHCNSPPEGISQCPNARMLVEKVGGVRRWGATVFT
jgi:hypothetical protein